jgi:putative FmdB family regulatory protein
MPLYEYNCPDCGETFERLRRMQDADRELDCPKCGSGEVKRLLSTFAPQMGGGGAGGRTAPCGAPSSACGSRRFT